MIEYIPRQAAIAAVIEARMPDTTPDGTPIANGKRSVSDCVRRIRDIPAVDVQPVKHGRWSGYSCSNCGISKYNFISFNIVGEKEYARPFGTWNYCPSCGAIMDGEE